MYEAEDIAALLREHPQLTAPRSARGPSLTFREARPDDAEFILSLRTDPEKNAHLSQVSDDVDAQRRWISENRDPYFIIEHKGPVGTVRMYDQRGTSFSWGSWILSDEAPKSAAVESTCMVYRIGLDLGFTASHFEVRKANEKVWQYHERWGAVRVGEGETDYYYSIDKGQILAGLERYRKPIEIDW